MFLLKESGQFGTNDPGNPIHNKDLAAGELLRLVQHRDRVSDVADSAEQRDGRRVLGAQQTDSAQIERLLRVAKTRGESIESGGQELCALRLLVGIGEFAHEKKEQLWILWRRNAVYCLQIFEFRTNRSTSSFPAIVF